MRFLAWLGVAVCIALGAAACQPEASSGTTDPSGTTEGDAGGEHATVSPESYAVRDTLTLVGVLVDVVCISREAESGRTAAPSSSDCSGTYVQQGYPVGLRTVASDEETVWMLVTVPQALADYLSSTVRVTGVVRSVTPSRSHIVIRHDDIPGFMDAMTMSFAVSEPELVEDIQRDDRIRFTFEIGKQGARIYAIERTD